jgi:hypothetical protein
MKYLYQKRLKKKLKEKSSLERIKDIYENILETS